MDHPPIGSAEALSQQIMLQEQRLANKSHKRSAFLNAIEKHLQAGGHQLSAVGLDRPGGEELALAELDAALNARNMAIRHLTSYSEKMIKQINEPLPQLQNAIRLTKTLLPESDNKNKRNVAQPPTLPSDAKPLL